MSITLNLPGPVSSNRTRRIDYAGMRAAAEWRRQADKHVLMQKRGALPKITGQYEALITVSEHCRYDLGNVEKLILDYAVSIGLVTNDSPRYLRRITIEFGDAPEGARLTITPIS